MTEPMHEVMVDGLTYGFRDRETGERFKRAVEGEAVDPAEERREEALETVLGVVDLF